jgi:hypothetical protein
MSVHQKEYLPDAAFLEAHWLKATASDRDKDCVEFAVVGDVIGVRDSKVPDGPILQFSRAEIGAMLAGAKKGEFDDLA